MFATAARWAVKKGKPKMPPIEPSTPPEQTQSITRLDVGLRGVTSKRQRKIMFLYTTWFTNPKSRGLLKSADPSFETCPGVTLVIGNGFQNWSGIIEVHAMRAEDIVRREILPAQSKTPEIGCDGSILLDPKDDITSVEKEAKQTGRPRSFEVLKSLTIARKNWRKPVLGLFHGLTF
ncbi:hypothetical protein EJB05_49679 [Eragrostis curvula]|uniref:Uncharacterized protein n=1 Tax=Eragrostis curvula TaxID=38414 RepID=A0A5J9T551_9POAL|nr:hypothetical protein EJB05_49679 [Eragrostis curvula]